MILLDTSVLSLALRRRTNEGPPPREVRALEELVAEDYPVGVPGIVFQELLSGVHGARKFERLHQVLQAFPLILATREHHVVAAHIANKCRTKGVAVAAADCLIAATTVATSSLLFTMDRDFERIASCSALRLYKPP